MEITSNLSYAEANLKASNVFVLNAMYIFIYILHNSTKLQLGWK